MAQHGKTQLQPAQCPLRRPQKAVSHHFGRAHTGGAIPIQLAQQPVGIPSLPHGEPMSQGCGGDSPPHSPSEGQAGPVQLAVRPPSQLAVPRSAKRSGLDLGNNRPSNVGQAERLSGPRCVRGRCGAGRIRLRASCGGDEHAHQADTSWGQVQAVWASRAGLRNASRQATAPGWFVNRTAKIASERSDSPDLGWGNEGL